MTTAVRQLRGLFTFFSRRGGKAPKVWINLDREAPIVVGTKAASGRKNLTDDIKNPLSRLEVEAASLERGEGLVLT